MVAGLVPTIIMLGGFLASLARCLRLVLRSHPALAQSAEWVLPLQAVAFLLMIIQFTYAYRSFDAMKDIFLFPGLLSFVAAFVAGIDIIERSPLSLPNVVARAACWCVVVLYILNISLVVQQLCF